MTTPGDPSRIWLVATSLLIISLLAPGFGPVAIANDASLPAPPTGLQAISGPRPGVVGLSWHPSATQGGAPVVGYRIYAGPDADHLVRIGAGPGLAFEDERVGPGRARVYAVSAFNEAGEGSQSGPVDGVGGIPPDVGGSLVQMGASLPNPNAAASIVWTGEVAYLFGGENGGFDIVRFDPSCACAELLGADLGGDVDASAAAWDGHYAYIFGGRGRSDVLRFDPDEERVESIGVLPSSRYGSNAIATPQGVLVLGGMHETATGEDELREVYDLALNAVTFELLQDTTRAATVWDGTLAYVMGGSDNGIEATQIFQIDPVTDDIVERNAFIAGGIEGHAAVWTGTEILVFGGQRAAVPLHAIAAYDPDLAADTRAPIEVLTSRLPEGLVDASAFWDGAHAWILGGASANANPRDSILRFTPPSPSDRGAPRVLAAGPGAAPGEIVLSWEPPADAGGLTGHRVYRGGAPATEVLIAQIPSTGSFVDRSLEDATSYCYVVTAVFGAIEGRSSEEICARTPGVPGAPSGFVAVPGPVEGEVRLSWGPPSVDGGSLVTGYSILRDGRPLADVENGFSFTDTGTPGTSYTYQVAAVNAVGAGVASATVTARAAARPGVPVSLLTQSGPAGDTVSLVWAAPAWSGTSPVKGYQVFRSDAFHDEELVATTGETTSFADSGLDEGLYSYRVAAVNDIGPGPRTDPGWGRAAFTPGAPVLRAQVGPGPGEVTLSWDPPVWKGDPQISGYHIAYVDAGTAQPIVVASATERSRVVHGLPRGAHVFEITAFNALGDGPASHRATAEAVALPSAPLDLTAWNGANLNSILLKWGAPEDPGGIVVSKYEITRFDDIGGTKRFGPIFAGEGGGGQYDDTDVVVGRVYTYAILAMNVVGKGAVSDGVSIVAWPSLIPARPACSDLVDNDRDGLIDELDPDCEDASDDDERSPACSDGLDNDHDGKVDLDDAGCTGPVDLDETNPLLPGQPRNVFVSATSAGTLHVRWDVPDLLAGGPVDHYLVYAGATSNDLNYVGRVGDTGRDFVESGLPPGLRHYAISAVNVLGEGDRSEVAKRRAFATYDVEFRAWIPQARVPDPDPFPPRASCGNGPYDELALVVDRWFEGDGHTGFDGSFRVRSAHSFKWDGASIFGSERGSGPFYGETRRYQRDETGRECLIQRGTVGKSSHSWATGNSFDLGYSALNPLVSVTPPTVDGSMTGAMEADGSFSVHYWTDEFPSHAWRFKVNGHTAVTVVSTDASCVDVTGANGAWNIQQGLVRHQDERTLHVAFGDRNGQEVYRSERC